MQNGDAGRELAATAATDADFLRVVATLTNGQEDTVVYRFAGAGGSSVGTPESNLIESVQGPGGTDLAGFEIALITFEITSLSIVSPGRDPNGDGNWTDHDLQGVIRIWGRQP